LWPWLWLGQWLHIGKNATMGMGGYTMDIIESRP
jgi:CRISPR/Cas system endoribonuclease Cas6 (RAMP superfamily)